MSKEELRILNQNHNRPKKRVTIQSVPSIEHFDPKLSPIDDEKLINICVNLHKSTFNGKFSQEMHVKYVYHYMKHDTKGVTANHRKKASRIFEMTFGIE
jgi:hypothetical protein